MSAIPLAGAVEGELRKRESLALLAKTRRALVRRACRAALEQALLTGTVTADDLRELVSLPAGINPKVFGTVFASLADAGLLRQVGFEKSRRPIAHRRPVGIWQLADRAGALTWLAANPLYPEPAENPQQTLFDQ